MKVVKFGGSSLASGKQMEKVYRIVKSDLARKIVVVSAPGKRFTNDEKVTDLLIKCAEAALQNHTIKEKVDAVIERYAFIAEELSL
ncbi:MAG TPA: aspartate kinase, partial [Pseudoneobacillus sp.]|nr:aspartate kinase [Pseudoneobacillus sp.]